MVVEANRDKEKNKSKLSRGLNYVWQEFASDAVLELSDMLEAGREVASQVSLSAPCLSFILILN
jgi:hypothetical protein